MKSLELLLGQQLSVMLWGICVLHGIVR